MERNIDIYASKLADEKLGKLGPGDGGKWYCQRRLSCLR